MVTCASYTLVVAAVSASAGFLIHGLMAGGRFSELDMRIDVLEKIIGRQTSDLTRILTAFHRLLFGIQNAPDLETAKALAMKISGEVFAKPVAGFDMTNCEQMSRNP